MTKDEALKLALEALEELKYSSSSHAADDIYYKATAAIREALADHIPDTTKMMEQPAQQQNLQELWHKVCPDAGAFVRASADDLTQFAKAVSAYQQPAQQQEPVAWGMPSAGDGFVVDCITPEEHDRVEGGYTIPLYTSPPASKPWAGLVMGELPQDGHNNDFLRGVVWAETKLREKNA